MTDDGFNLLNVFRGIFNDDGLRRPMNLNQPHTWDTVQNFLDLINPDIFELNDPYLQPVGLRVPGFLGLVDIVDIAVFVITEPSCHGNGVERFFQGHLKEMD